MITLRIPLALLLWSCLLSVLSAQPAEIEATASSSRRSYVTQRILDQAPVIDGDLSDPCWEQVEWGTGFTQLTPADGAAPTQETAFKILYDEKNLYLGFRCHDSSPDSVVSRMSRRDGFEGDWVEVNIDSYHDLRTAFSFTSSVSGVKGDEFVSNNGDNWDSSWNPIWNLKTQVDSLGWTAEVRIPLSQLRFSGEEEQVWGLQFTRRDFRNESRSIWQYIPQNSGYWVSGFGELKGIRGIKPQKQIEIQPYVVGQLETFAKEEGNPFADGFDQSLNAGVDGKIGITNDLTLDFTVNPDFGQVEADPSVLNLDGFRIFFSERRPFFIENRNIFDFAISNVAAGGPFGADNLFYSRRIGGAPHTYPDLNDDEYADVPENSTILGAAKFSGKLRNGLSIGVLESITGRMEAEIDEQGERRREVVEPLTNYFVGRLQQDFDGGNTVVGGILTATNRKLDGTGLDGLHREAYSGGLDVVHKWKDQRWELRGNLIFSEVQGSQEAILNTQTSFEHNFQRPDADHLEVDSTATSLQGWGGTVALGKFGGNFKFQGGVTWRSPGMEFNDLGFMRNADEIQHFLWAGYRWTQPFSIFRQLGVNWNEWASWDFGGNHLYQGFNTNFFATLTNFWGISSGLNYDAKDVSNNALFGGPALRRSNGLGNWFNLNSDPRKKLGFEYFMFHFWAFDKGVDIREYGIFARVQPTNAFNFSIGPSINFHERVIQYVTDLEYAEDTRFIAGTVDQRTLSLTIRLNYNITPNLTIQYYGQPFISRGRYDEFKYATNTLARELSDRYYQYQPEEISYDEAKEVYYIDELADGTVDYEFENPDFNFIQFRSNLVARWEYVPGSELFLVWTQGNTASGNPADRLVPSLTENLFTNQAHNIFLVKWTYRFLL